MVNLLLAIIYVAFISLGLPDGLLGAGWPAMYTQLDVPVSYAGIVSMIIAGGTIVSSLLSDRMTRALGAGKVTAISVATTAVSLFGFSFSPSFPILCVWAVPYGLGAGGVDAALNNYVAIHYESKHMNWLHAMWGVGAAVGPYIMGLCLQGPGWTAGYRIVGVIQVVLTACLLLSLPLWKGGRAEDAGDKPSGRPLSFRETFSISGAKQIILTFFCYCSIEQTTMLWVSSFFALGQGIDAEQAAFFTSLFLIGLTAGRFASGFLAMKLNDPQMIRLGLTLIGAGIVALFFASIPAVAFIALLLIGLGCAPVYPSIIHSTPTLFGADRSQAIVGFEMASAYVGTALMPPLFGVLAQYVSVNLLPVYLGVILVVMIFAFSSLMRLHGDKYKKDSRT